MPKLLNYLAEKFVTLVISCCATEVGRHRGEVTDIGEADGLPKDAVRIEFDKETGEPFCRLFPAERLAGVKAVFHGAEVEYVMYIFGTLSISRMRYVGPSRKELLAQVPLSLSDEDIAELGRK